MNKETKVILVFVMAGLIVLGAIFLKGCSGHVDTIRPEAEVVDNRKDNIGEDIADEKDNKGGLIKMEKPEGYKGGIGISE